MLYFGDVLFDMFREDLKVDIVSEVIMLFGGGIVILLVINKWIKFLLMV